MKIQSVDSNGQNVPVRDSVLTLYLLSLYSPFTQQATKKGGAKKKRPLSGFMKFSQEHRAKVKEENPDITFGGIGKKLGEMWRALSDKEKESYKTPKE